MQRREILDSVGVLHAVESFRSHLAQELVRGLAYSIDGTR